MSSTNFQELNLNNAFLFPAALEDPETCRLVLECITEETVGELKIKAEYTKLYNSEIKYIRLDVYARDVVTEVSYDLEMQNKDEYNLPLRSRYYQAQIDVINLKPGDEYKDLKPLYVIFICNFDPFDKEFYRYTFSMQCEEGNFPLDDGVKRIFFNTAGKNREEVPKILIDFLGYLNDSTDSYVEQDLDEKVKQIHERIKLLKQDRNVEKNYMHYLNVEKVIRAKEMEAEEAKRKAEEEKRKAEEAKRKAEEEKRKAEEEKRKAEEEKRKAEEEKRKAEEEKRKAEEEKRKAEEAQNIVREILFDSIAEMGIISEAVRECIEKEEDINILKSMHKTAMKAESMEQFEKQIVGL